MALLLPDGVGVRNFLHGGFVARASARWDMDVIHAIPSDLIDPMRVGLGSSVGWYPLEAAGDGRLITAVRNSVSYAHMYWARTEAMQIRLKRPWRSPTVGRWALTAAARGIGRLAASPAGIGMLERCHHAVATRESAFRTYSELFRQQRPDVLFCSHQRPPEIVAPVLAARSLGIPTAVFIFSWDNLSSKARIPVPFDHYLVWSRHMAAELMRYYPEVPRDRVHIVGSPQFDPYADPSLQWPREEFFRQLGADPGRPLICYSGGDVSTCPDDAGHVRLLLELIRSGRIQGNPQVVLRPSPVDDGTRYTAVREAFPELLYAPPAWCHSLGGGWARVMPMAEDVPFLANLTRHCDLNVNTASTMTLDFSIHDRPVVNIAFDLTQPPPLGRPLAEMYYRFEHYQPVEQIGAAKLARSPDQLADFVNRYLQEPALDRENRRRLVELEVDLPLGNSGTRILDALAHIGDGAGRASRTAS